MPRPFTMVSGMNPGTSNSSNISSEPPSPTRGMWHLSVMRVITEIGRLLLGASGSPTQDMMLALSTFMIGDNPDMRSQAILRESSSLSQDWTKAIISVRKPTLRVFESLLTITAALCCGFGMNTVSRSQMCIFSWATTSRPVIYCRPLYLQPRTWMSTIWMACKLSLATLSRTWRLTV